MAKHTQGPGPITIERQKMTPAVMTNRRVSWWYVYSLRDSGRFASVPGRGAVELDYAGTPLASIRAIARRLAHEQGRAVVDTTRSKKEG